MSLGAKGERLRGTGIILENGIIVRERNEKSFQGTRGLERSTRISDNEEQPP